MFQQGREHLAARGELVLGPRKKGRQSAHDMMVGEDSGLVKYNI